MKLNWPLVLFRHFFAGLLVLAWMATLFTRQSELLTIVMTFVMLGALAVISAQTVLMIEATTGNSERH
ncbi:MAG: hypothetical protein HY675_28620 [Chloroflexi bacterium]|nr:hypothetical protein [Chloroflexota bacterium]